MPPTPTRQPLKLLDAPEQLFTTPPAHFAAELHIFALVLALCIGPRVKNEGTDTWKPRVNAGRY